MMPGRRVQYHGQTCELFNGDILPLSEAAYESYVVSGTWPDLTKCTWIVATGGAFGIEGEQVRVVPIRSPEGVRLRRVTAGIELEYVARICHPKLSTNRQPQGSCFISDDVFVLHNLASFFQNDDKGKRRYGDLAVSLARKECQADCCRDAAGNGGGPGGAAGPDAPHDPAQ